MQVVAGSWALGRWHALTRERDFPAACAHVARTLARQARARGIIRADVLDFRPSGPYDLIVSISTLEHVGWDEESRDLTRSERAIWHLRSLLGTGGCLLATIPVGQNPRLDRLLADVRQARPWQEHRSATLVAVGWGGPIV